MYLERVVVFAFITNHILYKTKKKSILIYKELRYTIFNEIYYKLKIKCLHTTFLQQYNNHNSITVQKHQNITCFL